MLEKITLNDIACFKDQTEISDLRSVNYFYGSNGTGKTSISRVLENSNAFSHCTLRWDDNIPLSVYVYNRDFVEENFKDEIKGIFTLGKEDIKLNENINRLQQECSDTELAINQLTESKKEITSELESTKLEFQNECWNKKNKYTDIFKGAYTPHQGSRLNFSNNITKIIAQADFNENIDYNFDKLKSRAKKLLSENIDSISELVQPNVSALSQIRGKEILNKKIVGKKDLDISAIIQKLQNSDWVRQGQSYLQSSDGYCPFCQQKISDELEKNLEEYFGEAYLKDINAIDVFSANYKNISESVLLDIRKVLSSNPLVDNERLENLIAKFEQKISENNRIIDAKKLNLSMPYDLALVDEINSELITFFDEVNKEVKAHNKIAQDIFAHRETLKKDIWYFTAKELFDVYKRYKMSKDKIESKISATDELVKVHTDKLQLKKNELKKLEKNTTGIEATVKGINDILKSFGFHTFQISTDSNLEFYKLIRTDGSPASRTLSEGEKTFLTFLYFYHLLFGSHTTDGIVDNRVVVIDDPVSSLDSEIMLVVSEIIKNLVNTNIKKTNPGNIKQFLIFTHNVYFYKEITFKAEERQKNKNTYFIIRKNSEKSDCVKYEKSPIESSYSLLWREVSECNNATTIQNILRRILEVYFTHFGSYNSIRHLSESFGGEERVIYNALMSWTNEGSHSIIDDLYISLNDSTIEKYKEVFRKIFEKKGHLSHYIMMYNKYHEEKIEEVIL